MLNEIFGSAIIVAASSKIGYEAGNTYSRRVTEIRALQSGLWALQSEISFCQTMLEEALLKTSTIIPTVVSDVFLKASNYLKNKTGIIANDAWGMAVHDCEKKLSLNKNELSILYSFGTLLGVNDVVGQIRNIEVTLEKLKMCEKIAIDDEKKYGKLYKSLGLIGGLFLAIIFI